MHFWRGLASLSMFKGNAMNLSKVKCHQAIKYFFSSNILTFAGFLYVDVSGTSMTLEGTLG